MVRPSIRTLKIDGLNSASCPIKYPGCEYNTAFVFKISVIRVEILNMSVSPV